MYAASTICVLLRDANFDACICAGDFLAFVVSRTGDRAGLQGFGGGKEQWSHYWVKTGSIIIDLGPHYLPRGSSFEAASLPFIAWDTMGGLPKYLRYRPQEEFEFSIQRVATLNSAARNEAFVEDCRRRYQSQNGQPKLPAWLLTNEKSLLAAAARGDFWARNAMRFSEGMDEAKLPF